MELVINPYLHSTPILVIWFTSTYLLNFHGADSEQALLTRDCKTSRRTFLIIMLDVIMISLGVFQTNEGVACTKIWPFDCTSRIIISIRHAYGMCMCVWSSGGITHPHGVAWFMTHSTTVLQPLCAESLVWETQTFTKTQAQLVTTCGAAPHVTPQHCNHDGAIMVVQTCVCDVGSRLCWCGDHGLQPAL